MTVHLLGSVGDCLDESLLQEGPPHPAPLPQHIPSNLFCRDQARRHRLTHLVLHFIKPCQTPSALLRPHQTGQKVGGIVAGRQPKHLTGESDCSGKARLALDAPTYYELDIVA